MSDTEPVKAPQPDQKPKKGKKISRSLRSGSTRMRLFKALKAFPTGLSRESIKEVTGISRDSGHLTKILKRELEAGRIRSEETGLEGRRNRILYFLTSKGAQDLKAGDVDINKTRAGREIGKPWGEARRAAQNKIS
jgi:hypothetical protein